MCFTFATKNKLKFPLSLRMIVENYSMCDVNAKENTELHTFELGAPTGCPRRNVPDFGRVFLMLKFTDITQNTCIQS